MKNLILALLTVFMVINGAYAQDNNNPPAPMTISQANNQLEKISTKLNSGKATSDEISDYIQDMNDILTFAAQEKLNLTSSLDNVQKKINALGAAPVDGAKEPAAIASQRKTFNKEADAVKTQIAQTDLIKTKVDEMNNLILKIRNQKLLDNILVKQSSIFHPQEFWNSLVSFSGFVVELIKSPVSWYSGLSKAKQEIVKNNILIVGLAMSIALIAAIYLSLYVKKWFGYKSNIEKPNYSQKVRAGVAMFIARGLIPAALVGAFLLWLKNTTVINIGNFGLLLNTTAVYLLYYYLLKAVVKVTFSPLNSRWRIIEVEDDKAKSISSALIFSIAAICIVSLFQTLATQMSYDTNVVYSLKIFANGVKAFCIVLVARKFLYDNNVAEDEAYVEENGLISNNNNATNAAEDEDEIHELSTESKVSLFITFAMIVTFSLSLFGYIRLSEFIIDRFIASVVTIGVFYIFDKLIRVLFHQLLLFKFWVRIFRIHRRRLVKTEFWFGLLLKPVLGIICILTLLAIWGVSVDILLNNVKSFLVGFDIGGIHISITSILLGIISFLVSMALFKMLKGSFVSGSLSKIEMDEGVKDSVLSLIGVIGIIFSAILAIAVMGGSLSSITIIAGALSFGVGLGLQNMVSNLAAGFTILFERPIKVGDWVVIDGYEGIVKDINMRSTELETFSKSNVIIPNSDILSKSLVNLTYANRMGRVEIKVGVDYNSDIETVKNTLVEIALSNKGVLKTPAPAVSFVDLADSSLNFQLNCFTANVYNKSSISDDLREKIINRFRELNINIPYPQQVVYLQTDNSTAAPTGAPVVNVQNATS